MLVHMHIPKTAGLSVRNMATQWFECRKAFFTNAVEDIGDEDPRDYEFFSAHIGYYKLRELCGEDAKIFTFLRDPVDRIISNYYFFQDNQKMTPLVEFARAHSLIEFAEKHSNLATFMLSDPTPSIDIALENLHNLHFVGLFEEFPLSINLLCLQNKFATPLKYSHINKSKRPRLDEIDESTKRRIRAAAHHDIRLYEEATKIFKKQTVQLTINDRNLKIYNSNNFVIDFDHALRYVDWFIPEKNHRICWRWGNDITSSVHFKSTANANLKCTVIIPWVVDEEQVRGLKIRFNNKLMETEFHFKRVKGRGRVTFNIDKSLLRQSKHTIEFEVPYLIHRYNRQLGIVVSSIIFEESR